MLFNSLSFAIFLPIVFFLYWFATKGSHKIQNILLLFASYYFYGCWDWRFLFLLMFSTFLDYYTGRKIFNASNTKNRKFWLWLSIIVNLGFLGLFKYYNFFITSFAEGLSAFGLHLNYTTIKVVLPVGISFYTFHGISYVLDIYYRRIKPENNFVDYSVFVSFFPLLVAGPIERATHLLPQIIKKRTFDYSKAVDGLRQILWGLFKKIVVADNCAYYANDIFNNSEAYGGSTLLIGSFFFAVQIYCDFSGYSDIALGTSRLFGIELLRNFSFPYFSRDIAEFWRRWHISLSSWFRDYLYIPLGGSKGGVLMRVRNTFIIFLVSGFWHGANWTFIVWGALNAIYFLPLLLSNNNRNNLDIIAKGKILPSTRDFFSMLLTFTLTCLAWIFFRSENIAQALNIVYEIFSPTIFVVPVILPKAILGIVGFFFLIEWLGREHSYAIASFASNKSRIVRWSFYYLLIFFIYYFAGEKQQFIYFQF
jgi:D-alanyl-lipoteichoic acid acyltransferase DltB (MBOAT superfamily)